ncbi:enhanced serine sensitivity protein SseB [Phaeacidiphilus oryzae]|uniref:enhanced serine sensitivity protein SseB n=1 Tax=Phaeacidiphilus oryzae TaxID=348818 RepID=UPI000A0082C9|nr:enhanced serine sensitivity protein SseB [Phaeacidiphilus oryzae]
MTYPPEGMPVDHAHIPGQQHAAPAGAYAGSHTSGGSLGGWPENELEQVLSLASGDPGATPRVVEVLGRSRVWVPLPNGGDPASDQLNLPSMELAGQLFVPVFSSETQLRTGSSDPSMPFVVAPVREFARGLPVGVGIAVNPGGVIGIPIPAEGVRTLCGGGEHENPEGAVRPGAGGGSRVSLRQPASHEDPVEFLAAAASEFAGVPVVLTARRALASAEGEPEKMYVGVELDGWQPADQEAATLALGRALGAVPLPWEVNIVLLDVAQDPVGDWLLAEVAPFFARG